MKLNNAQNYESIDIKLSKDRFPIAYQEKVDELIEECGISRLEAEQMVNATTFEIELYYEKGLGLFCVESDAIDSNVEIYSPYSGEVCERDKND